MNELISLAELTFQNLSTGVLHLLTHELGEHGTVAEIGNKIHICISRADFEQRLGNLLQQIYRTPVDQHFPVRERQLIHHHPRCGGKNMKPPFKIWPTAPDRNLKLNDTFYGYSPKSKVLSLK